MTDQLISSYTEWRDEPFPPGSTQDAVDEAHAELATIDTWLADMVVPFVEGGRTFPLRVDVKTAIERLQGTVQALRDHVDAENQSLLDRYARYLNLLDKVFAAYTLARG